MTSPRKFVRSLGKDGGFTLLETLSVMVIVGLLATIVVPQVSTWRKKAAMTAVKADIKHASNLMESAYDGSYPDRLPAGMNNSKGVKVCLGSCNVLSSAESAKLAALKTYLTGPWRGRTGCDVDVPNTVSSGWLVAIAGDTASVDRLRTLMKPCLDSGNYARLDSTIEMILNAEPGTPFMVMSTRQHGSQDDLLALQVNPVHLADVPKGDQNLYADVVVADFGRAYAATGSELFPGDYDPNTYCITGLSTKHTDLPAWKYTPSGGLVKGSC